MELERIHDPRPSRSFHLATLTQPDGETYVIPVFDRARLRKVQGGFLIPAIKVNRAASARRTSSPTTIRKRGGVGSIYSQSARLHRPRVADARKYLSTKRAATTRGSLPRQAIAGFIFAGARPNNSR